MQEYIRRIVYFIVFQTVGEMIFPEKFRGYLRLIMSLTAVMIIMSPLGTKNFGFDFNFEPGDDIYKKSNEIISQQYNSIIENRLKDKGIESAETNIEDSHIGSIYIEGKFEDEQAIKEDISKSVGVDGQRIYINGR